MFSTDIGRLVLIAFRNLAQNKRRTGLLGGAIAAVTMLLVILLSVSYGIQDTMLRAVTTLSTGHVNVAGFYKITSGQSAPVVTKYKDLRKLVDEHVPEADLVVDRLRGWGKVVSPTNSMQLGIGGVEVTQEERLRDVLQIVDGDLMGLAKPRTALLFESQAEKLDVGVGDRITLSVQTVRGANNSLDVTVAALAKDMGLISGFSILTPKETLREIYLLDERSTGAIQIYLKNVEDSQDVAERLRRVIDEAGYMVMEPTTNPFFMKFAVVNREEWTGQKIDVTTWEDELKFLTYALTTFDSLTFIVVAVLLIIIVIGVMNALWMAIRERTTEIGTLRAIGMGRGRVMLMFVIEAALLSLGATVLGALLGAGIAGGLNMADIGVSKAAQLFLMRDTLRLVVDVGGTLQAIATISSVVTLFSLFPALRAARLKPVTAIHHIG